MVAVIEEDAQSLDSGETPVGIMVSVVQDGVATDVM